MGEVKRISPVNRFVTANTGYNQPFVKGIPVTLPKQVRCHLRRVLSDPIEACPGGRRDRQTGMRMFYL